MKFRFELVTARGSKVGCLIGGRGSTNVLLMHGNPSDAWVYERFLAAAPEDYRIAAINWYGKSERPWGGYTASGFADQARDVMDALGMKTASLGGHSLGGLAALIFAVSYPNPTMSW